MLNCNIETAYTIALHNCNVETLSQFSFKSYLITEFTQALAAPIDIDLVLLSPFRQMEEKQL